MTSDAMQKLLLLHSSDDLQIASILTEEILCFGWQPYAMALGNLPVSTDWRTSVQALIETNDVFCFLVSASFEASPACLAELEEVRNQRGGAPRFLILVDIKTSRCIDKEITLTLRRGLGGVSRNDVINVASQIDAVARRLPHPAPPTKQRRQIALKPKPLSSLLSQGDLRIRRRDIEGSLILSLRSNRVLAVYGLPSSGRSTIVLEALDHLSEFIPDRMDWPTFLIASRDVGGTVPDLRRLCSKVFELLGPPPASAAEDAAAALVTLLEGSEAWLFLDQFETAVDPEGNCKNADFARFFRLADEMLDRGRVIFTSGTPGILMEGGRRCAYFRLPEWTTDELDQLAKHVAEACCTVAPSGLAKEKVRHWASGNPYLLVLALREWCATGRLPQGPRGGSAPFQAIASLEQSISPTGLNVLQVLSILASFPVSERLLRRTIERTYALLPATGSPNTVKTVDELRQLVASGLVHMQHGPGGASYWLPGIVTNYMREVNERHPDAIRNVGEVVARSFLEESDCGEVSLPLLGPAVFDGRDWLWPHLSSEKVGCALRAADALINAGLADKAVDVLTQRGSQLLKLINRVAPASVRKTLFMRLSSVPSINPFWKHESSRGWALALADGAEFRAAIEVLETAADSLNIDGKAEDPANMSVLKAKNLDLRAYCLRQVGSSVESIRMYDRALEILGDGTDDDERCKLLRGAANSWVTLRDSTKAHALFDEAYAVANKLPSERRHFNVGRIDCDRALSRAAEGNFKTAENDCLAGMHAMRSAGDLWNERIALLNLAGIEFALRKDVVAQKQAIQDIVPDLVRLESIVALRAARSNLDYLDSDFQDEDARKWWVFVELT